MLMYLTIFQYLPLRFVESRVGQPQPLDLS